MSDRRLTPANARVAAADLGQIPDGVQPVTPTAGQITDALTDLRRAPGGARDRQLLFGDPVDVLETREGWSFVRSGKDGYVGYIRAGAHGPALAPSHWVCAPATHAYAQADMKSPDRHSLSFGSRVTVTSETNGFMNTNAGFVPHQHLMPVGTMLSDPISVAELFLGTPYLWGGNSRSGLDCSALVQFALLASGHPFCPGDSDLQERALGEPVTDGSMQAGDLLFWKGHVAIVTTQTDRMIHANAHHMAVQYESIQAGIDRIMAQGDGPVVAQKRLL